MYRRGLALVAVIVAASLTAIGASAQAAVPLSAASPNWPVRTQLSKATSPNWSGYVALAAVRFTAASGRWRQPAARCPDSTHSVAAFWVGLDGYQNQTVEQIGVEAECASGTARYFAWWQMWPGPATDLSAVKYPVHPGDVVRASVVHHEGRYTLSISSSEGWGYQTTEGSKAQAASAEWIASSPRLCRRCRYALLTDFTMVRFLSAEAATGGSLEPLSSFRHDRGPTSLTMVNESGTARARPGSLGCDGRSFEVDWAHL